MTPTKTARWVDASAIIDGLGSMKLVTANGATIAKVLAPTRTRYVWRFEAGRSRSGNCHDKADGIRECNRWAESRGYAVVPLVLA